MMHATPHRGGLELLEQSSQGDSAATTQLFEMLYRELRDLAGAYMRRELEGQTLQATVLVHEAYLRIAGTETIAWESEQHFYHVVARAMRRFLVDYARRKKAAKRGGDHRRIPFSDCADRPFAVDELLDLDAALDRLAEKRRDLAELVVLHHFGGLTFGDVADRLAIPTSTVHDRWKLAKAMLLELIEGESDVQRIGH